MGRDRPFGMRRGLGVNTGELSVTGGPGLAVTLALLGAGAIVFGLAAFMHGRPRVDGKPPVVPWMLVMLIAVTWCFVMIVHLVNVLGVETGRGRPF